MTGRAAAASSLLGRSCRALLPFLPFGVYITDELASLHFVDDDSMEPALRAGDVVLVRRADALPGRLWDSLAASAAAPGAPPPDDAASGIASDGLRVMALDASSGAPVGDRWTGRTYSSPPLIYRPGQAVLVRRPDASRHPSSETCVRRVVGLGGQAVRTARGGGWRRRRAGAEEVPPYAVWVESDRGDGGEGAGADSRTYGPVCKTGVVGVAEAVVWPPWRAGGIDVAEPEAGRSWWPR